MKICKQCNAAQADDAQVCALCGADLTEEAPLEEAFSIEPEEALPEEAGAEETSAQEVPCAEAPSQKKSYLGLIIGLVLAALLVVAVIIGKGKYDQSREAGSQALHTNAYGYLSNSVHYELDEAGAVTYSYMNEQGATVSVEASSVEAWLDETVAACGDRELTNRELQYYYDQQFYSFYSMYSSYISYVMNLNQPLDEQVVMGSEDTWQRSFLTGAVEMFQQVAALCQQGEAEGFTLTEEQQAQVDSAVDFAAAAAQYGYDDVEQFLRDQLGPHCTGASYESYVRDNLYAQYYAAWQTEQVEVSDAEIEAYYDENAEAFTSSNIQKVDKNVVSVRHILIMPESVTAEDGTSSITDEAWAAAEAEAQRIYDEWLEAGATEEAFAELAAQYTQDPGSQTTGGLYENVFPGQMATEFNDWCFADGRKSGDHGIVKTESYGYHIMFFSGEGDYIYWRLAAESDLKNNLASESRTALTESFSPTADLDKAVLLDAAAPTAPAAE